ncbi:MAG: hypothetical protein HEQ16_04970 [Bosea sp.]|nr:hypothetical protein [Bosea sp. (in: a-proteobacteria)]
MAIQVCRGDELTLPFLLTAGGAIVNLSAGELTAQLHVGRELALTLTAGAGITIENPAPPPAAPGAAQSRHGVVTLTEAETELLGRGALNRLRLRFTTSMGRRISSLPVTIEGIDP